MNHKWFAAINRRLRGSQIWEPTEGHVVQLETSRWLLGLRPGMGHTALTLGPYVRKDLRTPVPDAGAFPNSRPHPAAPPRLYISSERLARRWEHSPLHTNKF